MRVSSLLSSAVVAAMASTSMAVTLAEFTFETSVPALDNSQSAGPYTAEGGIFAAESVALGVHASPNTDWTNPVGNGSGESFSSNDWAFGDYYEFRVPTTGYQDITFSWHQTRSSTGPATFELTFSTDGVNFTSLTTYTVPTVTWSAGSPDATNQSVFGPIDVPGAEDASLVYFRLVAAVAPGGTGGTSRVDNIVVAGTPVPEPATLSLLVLGTVMLRGRRGR
jgi:hypothetical protein